MPRIDASKLEKIDLNAPAFGPGSQKLDDLKIETSVEETPVIIKEEEEDDEEPVGENKVPYSRFKKYHDRATEAEAEAERWRIKAEELESSRVSRREPADFGEMSSKWKDLYGDTEASQKAWDVQQQMLQEWREDVRREAYEEGQRGAEELEVKQRVQIETNVATIDESFEVLSDYVGRDLTAKEQSAILDIVDDFTPKDDFGRYAGPLIPFEKAWEMFELKQDQAKATARKDRDNVASLSGTSTSGNTEVGADTDKNFNPLERGSWRKRLGL